MWADVGLSLFTLLLMLSFSVDILRHLLNIAPPAGALRSGFISLLFDSPSRIHWRAPSAILRKPFSEVELVDLIDRLLA
jgi:hypothetical protein